MTTVDAPRTGPLHRHEDGGSLWYIHPLTGERFLSVTSGLDFADMQALSYYWRPGLTAKAAFDELPRLIVATRIKPCGRTNSRCRSGDTGHDWRVRCSECPCGECQPCVTLELRNRHFAESRRATDRGSAVHHAIEFWTLHGVMPTVADEIEPYCQSFLRFVEDYGLTPESWEMTEATVLNRRDRWGGTLDGRVRFSALKTKKARELCEKFGKAEVLVSLDTKSREVKEAAFQDSMSLQLSAYRRGEVVLLDDGTEVPLPPDDGAVVVQIHQEGYHCRPVRTEEKDYRAFLGLFTYAYWSIEDGTSATQVKTFPRLEIPGLPPEPKKRAPRKTAKAAVAVEPTPAAEPAPATQAPARMAAASTAQRTATALLTSAGKPIHPDSPFGDNIPF